MVVIAFFNGDEAGANASFDLFDQAAARDMGDKLILCAVEDMDRAGDIFDELIRAQVVLEDPRCDKAWQIRGCTLGHIEHAVVR